MIVLTSFVSVLGYHGFYYSNPGNQGWWNSEEFSWLNAIQFMVVDQMLIECITVFILFWLIRKYAELFKLTSVPLKPKFIFLYEISFLPIALLAFFFFNPVTQTVRFLYHYLPRLDWSVYFVDYFYSQSIYFAYLIIVLIQTLAILNINLFRNYYLDQIRSSVVGKGDKKYLRVFNDSGERLLEIGEIIYTQRIDKKCYIFTDSGKYRVLHTISVLEKILDSSEFVRINRSTIASIAQIDHYAFWEYDKYVLKLLNGKEFVVSRDRLRSIKSQLNIS